MSLPFRPSALFFPPFVFDQHGLLNGDKLSSTIYKANVIDEPLGTRNSDRVLESEVVLENVE